MSRFSECPKCKKKGHYLVTGYDPVPTLGDLYACRYCDYHKRVLDVPAIEEFVRGTQVIYVPTHAQGKIDHADTESGFVTSTKNGDVYCRFWSKHDIGRLSTKDNSVMCKPHQLAIQETRPQDEVTKILSLLDERKPVQQYWDVLERVYQDPLWPKGDENDTND